MMDRICVYMQLFYYDTSSNKTHEFRQKAYITISPCQLEGKLYVAGLPLSFHPRPTKQIWPCTYIHKESTIHETIGVLDLQATGLTCTV
jgi:hypothetical protein